MNYEYCDGITHTIKQGETLYSLSRYYKVPLAILLRANPYIDVYNLKTGDTVCVPVKNTGKNRGTSNNRNASSMGQTCKNIAVMPRTGMDGRNSQENMGMDAGMPEDTSTGMERTITENANMPRNNTGMGLNMGMGLGMDMNRNVQEKTDAGMNMNMGMDTNMPGSTDTGMNMNMGMDANMPRNTDTGMSMDNTDNMDAGMSNNDKGSIDVKENENCWIKYVAQAGDTLQDIFDRSECSKEMFWNKNSADRMYMLPGVAYFILENNVE